MQTSKKNIISRLITAIFLFLTSMFSLDAAWSPPVQISSGASSINASGSPLVIDNNSVALVGWLNGQIGISQTLSSANLLPYSTAWTTPETIFTNTTPGVFPSFPTMSVDMEGNSLAAFGLIDPFGTSFLLNASRRSFQSNVWNAPISQLQTGIAFGGSIAIGNMGNFSALLALTETLSSPYNITLIQLPANSSSWLAPIVVAQDNSAQPAVAVRTHFGKSTLAWKVNTPSLQLQTDRFNFETQQFYSPSNVPLPPGTLDIVGIDLALDSHDNAVLIYLVQFAAGNALYSSTLLSGEGNTWSSPLLISDLANSALEAVIGADANGNATIIWTEQTANNQQFVRAATLPLNGTPTFITNLTSNATLNTNVTSVKVATDSFGNAVAVWGITIAGIQNVQVSSKAVGQNWVPYETLSTTGMMPLVALSDQGTAVVTWIDSITNVLLGSRNLYVFSLQPPTDFFGKVIKNQFLTETSYFLQMDWIPSLAPNILYYEIFRNGKLIATIPGDGAFTFLQHLHSKHVSGSYTLVATASNGNKNVPVPLVIR